MDDEDVRNASRKVACLVGEALHLLGVGRYQVTLELGGGQLVQLETSVRVGDQEVAEPAALNGLALLLPLLQQEVTGASVVGQGRLVLTLGDTTLGCSPHDQYEAWNYTGSDGTLVVCQPGGGLAIWSGG